MNRQFLIRWLLGMCVVGAAALGVRDARAEAGDSPVEAGSAQAEKSRPLIIEFSDPNPWTKRSVYSTYQDGRTTIVVRHSSDEGVEFDPAEPFGPDLGAASVWYAGARTGGELARALVVERPVWVLQGAPGYKPGSREFQIGRDAPFYQIYEDLEIALTATDKRREIGGQMTRGFDLKIAFQSRRVALGGKQLEEQAVAYAHRLWIAPKLAYSPAFIVPFRVIGRLFVEDRQSGLGEYIRGQVEQKLRDKGLVLGMEFRVAGADKPLYQMEARALSRAGAPIVELPEFPVMDAESFRKFASIAALSRAIGPNDDAAVAASEFSLYTGAKKGEPLLGNAVFGSNQRGDFALLLRVEPDPAAKKSELNREFFLLLMRPMHGTPEPGAYRVVDMPEDIESLSEKKLEKLSNAFSAIALIREQAPGAEHPTFRALWEVKSGEVTIIGPEDVAEQKPASALRSARKKALKRQKTADPAQAEQVSAEDRPLAGHIELKLGGVELGDDVSEASVSIRGTFIAVQGLENVGSSKITQVLRP